MPSPAPAPRLPLAPADRPLYRPPARFGCSGVVLVSVAALLAFVYFLQVVAPAVSDRIRELPVPGIGVTATTTPEGGDLGETNAPLPLPQLTPTLDVPVAANPATPIPLPPSATPPPPSATPPPATPLPEFVAVGNTDGTGVFLRVDPRADARRLVALADKTVLLVAGPDQTAADGAVWRNVRTLRDPAQTGWILAQYLVPSSGP
jgi:hypothetical protein